MSYFVIRTISLAKRKIKKINKKEVDLIVALYKDRLLRFGFELVEHFAKLNNVSIEVIDKIVNVNIKMILSKVG